MFKNCLKPVDRYTARRAISAETDTFCVDSVRNSLCTYYTTADACSRIHEFPYKSIFTEFKRHACSYCLAKGLRRPYRVRRNTHDVAFVRNNNRIITLTLYRRYKVSRIKRFLPFKTK